MTAFQIQTLVFMTIATAVVEGLTLINTSESFVSIHQSCNKSFLHEGYVKLKKKKF